MSVFIYSGRPIQYFNSKRVNNIFRLIKSDLGFYSSL